MTTSISFYSDANCTIPISKCYIGDTLYLNGDITTLNATTGTDVKIDLYIRGTPDVLKGNMGENNNYNFVANTVTSIKTTIFSGTAPSISTVGYSAGKYYALVTVSGIGVQTTYDTENIEILSVPKVNVKQNNPSTLLDESTLCSLFYDNEVPNEVKINDILELDQNLNNVNVKVYIKKANHDLVTTLLTTTYNFIKDTLVTLKTINGNVLLSYPINPNITNQELYVHVELTHTDLVTSNGYEAFRVTHKITEYYYPPHQVTTSITQPLKLTVTMK